MSVPNPTALAGLLAEVLDEAVDESEGWVIQASAKGRVVRLVVDDEGVVHTFRAVIVDGESVVAQRPDLDDGLELEGGSFRDEDAPGWQVVPFNSSRMETCNPGGDADSVLVRGARYMPVEGFGHISFAEARRMGAALIALADAHEADTAQKAGGEEAPEDPQGWIPDGSSKWDWEAAIEAATHDTATADAPAVPTTPITMADVAAVDAYAIFYHDQRWKPGDSVGSELQLYAVLRLKDGRWASMESWNDYTGWGCQDGSAVRIGPDRDSVIRFGLTEDARRALGLSWGGEGR